MPYQTHNTTDSKPRKHATCPISGKSDLVTMSGYEDNYLVKCKSSKFVFSHRIPTEPELKEHYSGYNRQAAISNLTLTRYREILSTFEQSRKSNNIFDIGCGMGDFLEVAKDMGWNVYGCEYTEEAISACAAKGINVRLGAPDQTWFETGFFDIVTSFEVIEHLTYPVEQVKFATHLLRESGVFYCTTPNFNALERYLLRGKYNVIGYPEHLSYFTKRTLNTILINNGLKKVSLVSTGISPQRIQQSIIKKPKTAKTQSSNMDERFRQQMESKGWRNTLKNIVTRVLNLTSTGNALKALYVKQ